MVFRIYMV